ncbi:MAG: hypothetical protein IGQ45_12000 [Cyanobacterium sp. T60_A2020_053]|nr:hypothetical protein [Cyanobacterium sp. T60_A2020_053]
MFVLRVKFKATAHRLGVLDLSSKEFTPQRLRALVSEYLPKKLDWAMSQRQDLDDLATLWEILGIDAVIRLENEAGENIRVGVSLLDNENKAQNLIYDLKGQVRTSLRHELGIEQYWVFVLRAKNYPSDEDWIDILYGEIDQPPTASGCRLIVL